MPKSFGWLKIDFDLIDNVIRVLSTDEMSHKLSYMCFFEVSLISAIKAVTCQKIFGKFDDSVF